MKLKGNRALEKLFGRRPVSEKDHDAWQYKKHLETLRKGGTLEPDPGLVGDKEYISRCIDDYYGGSGELTVLGAGCGTGRIEAWLCPKVSKVICLDYYPEALEVSRIHAKRLNCDESFVAGDISRMPFQGESFDFIYSGGVLEHFENPRVALGEYLRVTRLNGVIIISVPNLVGVNARLGMRPLAEFVSKRKRLKHGHIERYFGAREFREIIEQSGFECLDISPTFFNVFNYFPFKYIQRILYALGLDSVFRRALGSFGRKFPGIAFGYSFMIALARKSDKSRGQGIEQ
jgi:ubiquinone/menaquinone biosynthesis C-methylase UbiE